MTYHERLEAYRRRLLRELDRELDEVTGWLDDETDADARDGFACRIEDLRRERDELDSPRSRIGAETTAQERTL